MVFSVPGERRGARRPELSQHFLRSGALAASLVAQTSLISTDIVVEVGAGFGALTHELARRAGRVVAVEIDQELAARLRTDFADRPHVEVVTDDFLALPLAERDYKVVGNIPFSRTAEIVRRLTETLRPPTDSFLVVQREAAERFAGAPFAPETRPSLLLKSTFQVEILRRLRRTDFAPPPSVDCVLLWLAHRPRPLVSPPQQALYRGFVLATFGHGRTVGEALRGLLTRRQVARLAHDLRFDATGAPSSLTFDQWLGLFRFFAIAADERIRARVKRADEQHFR